MALGQPAASERQNDADRCPAGARDRGEVALRRLDAREVLSLGDPAHAADLRLSGRRTLEHEHLRGGVPCLLQPAHRGSNRSRFAAEHAPDVAGHRRPVGTRDAQASRKLMLGPGELSPGITQRIQPEQSGRRLARRLPAEVGTEPLRAVAGPGLVLDIEAGRLCA